MEGFEQSGELVKDPDARRRKRGKFNFNPATRNALILEVYIRVEGPKTKF